MRRFRSYFLILLALWLPLQAAAAWVMPFCSHAAAQEQAASAEHCHHDGAAEAAVPATSGLDCDNCEMCHLASAGYLLAEAEAIPSLLADDVLVAPPGAALPSHIGEPPQQPPRRTN